MKSYWASPMLQESPSMISLSATGKYSGLTTSLECLMRGCQRECFLPESFGPMGGFKVTGRSQKQWGHYVREDPQYARLSPTLP